MNKVINNLTNQELVNLLDSKVDSIKESYRIKCFYVSRNDSIELIGIARFLRHNLDALTRTQYNYYVDLGYEMKDKSNIEIQRKRNIFIQKG